MAVSDGTTTAVLLTGELLEGAEKLLNEGLHPTTILAGYYWLVLHAQKRLKDYGIEVEDGDDGVMQAIVQATVTGKWDDTSAERFADLATRGVHAVATETVSISVTLRSRQFRAVISENPNS